MRLGGDGRSSSAPTSLIRCGPMQEASGREGFAQDAGEGIEVGLRDGNILKAIRSRGMKGTKQRGAERREKKKDERDGML